MDIDNMPAGREMDALVAEKVMGWIRVPWKFNPQQDILVPPGGERAAESPDHWGADWWWLAPHYSTADGMALALLERFGGRHVTMTKWPPANYWQVIIMHDRHPPMEYYVPLIAGDVVAQAPTLALAICRAALMTVPELAQTTGTATTN